MTFALAAFVDVVVHTQVRQQVWREGGREERREEEERETSLCQNTQASSLPALPPALPPSLPSFCLTQMGEEGRSSPKVRVGMKRVEGGEDDVMREAPVGAQRREEEACEGRREGKRER